MNYDFVREEILQGTDIVDLIGSHISLKKSGDSYLGICPFHNEKSPSFTVSGGKQIYKCFGCGEAGNAYSFIMKYENISFKEAMEKLAERINYTIPVFKNKHEKLYELNTASAKFFYSNFVADEKVKKYLYNRLDEKTAKKFGLGYSKTSWDSLYKYLISKGYAENDIIKAGLVIKRDNQIYDRFRGRLMFPIFNPAGKIIGFGGRVIDTGEPKYLNSPDSPLYNKSLSLYGINFIKNITEVILVEGYMDVLALHSFGYTNAIAVLGTAFTNEHAHLLKTKRISSVTIIFDSDDAGQKAIERAIKPLFEKGIEIRILTFKNAKDPDEFLKNFGKELFEKELEFAKNYMEYCIDTLSKKYNIEAVSEKRDFLNELASKLKIVKDDIELEVYVGFIAEKFGISKEAFLSKTKEVAFSNFSKKPVLQNKNMKALEEAKYCLLNLAFHNIGFREVLQKHLSMEEFPELYEVQEDAADIIEFNKIAANDYIKIIKETYIKDKLEENLPDEEVNKLLSLRKMLKKQYIEHITG
ncbi:MAG: DNA primase [Defluviitaleaceae bacterium]|nr:DNA primase [Defluviitaleaceae bacterium]